jgi:hypothetical protein
LVDQVSDPPRRGGSTFLPGLARSRRASIDNGIVEKRIGRLAAAEGKAVRGVLKGFFIES